MSKYHFLFEDRLGKQIAEYDTDIEPPAMGDIVGFTDMMPVRNNHTYVVADRVYMPVNESRVNITFTLEIRGVG